MIFILTIVTLNVLSVHGNSLQVLTEQSVIAKYRHESIESKREANKRIFAIELDLRRFKTLMLQRVLAYELKKNNSFKQLFKECMVHDDMCPIMCPIQETISKPKSLL